MECDSIIRISRVDVGKAHLGRKRALPLLEVGLNAINCNCTDPGPLTPSNIMSLEWSLSRKMTYPMSATRSSILVSRANASWCWTLSNICPLSMFGYGAGNGSVTLSISTALERLSLIAVTLSPCQPTCNESWSEQYAKTTYLSSEYTDHQSLLRPSLSCSSIVPSSLFWCKSNASAFRRARPM